MADQVFLFLNSKNFNHFKTYVSLEGRQKSQTWQKISECLGREGKGQILVTSSLLWVEAFR